MYVQIKIKINSECQRGWAGRHWWKEGTFYLPPEAARSW